MRGRTRQFVSLDEHADEDGKGIGELEDSGYTPEQLCSQRELAGVVRRLAAGVRASSRQVLELHLRGDLSDIEIAQVLKAKLPAVKSRLHRGKQDMRRTIPKYLSSADLSQTILNTAARRGESVRNRSTVARTVVATLTPTLPVGQRTDAPAPARPSIEHGAYQDNLQTCSFAFSEKGMATPLSACG
jgi:hypothetical protein